jgi:hypothetical protein
MKILMILSALICITCKHVYAQSSEGTFLENKNLAWASSYDVYLPLDLNFTYINSSEYQDCREFSMNLSNLLFWPDYRAKDIYSPEFLEMMNLSSFSVNLRKKMDMDGSFASFLFHQCKTGQLDVYKDADLTQKYSAGELDDVYIQKDTFERFDYETNEYVEDYQQTELDPMNFMLLKARIIVYYDNSINSWRVFCKSVAPVHQSRYEGSYAKKIELCWIPVANLNSTIDYRSPEINYVNKTQMGVSFKDATDYTYKMSKGNLILESSSIKECHQAMMNFIRDQPENNFVYKELLLDSASQFSQNELRTIGKSIDTLEVFDELNETYSTVIESHDVQVNHITGCRFIQEWYWDDKIKQLQFVNFGFAPVIDKKSRNGEYIFTVPFFWKKIGS